MSSQNPHHRRSSSSSFPSCFRPSTTTTDDHHPTIPPPLEQLSGTSNLTTSLYQTHYGLFSLSWSSIFLGHSLHLQLHSAADDDDPFFPSSSSVSLYNPLPPSTFSFRLNVNPYAFWRNTGSKKISTPRTARTPKVRVFWDFSRVKFGSGPEPQSGFYLAVVVNNELTLLVGDSGKEAYPPDQMLAWRTEHVVGNRVFKTKTRFKGKSRDILIDCRTNDAGKLCFSFDGKRVLDINRLKWKFRGNERIEIEGVQIQISWDVYNWLFNDSRSNEKNGHAVFMFRFENLDHEEENQRTEQKQHSAAINNPSQLKKKNGVISWHHRRKSCSFGLNGIEWSKMRKSFRRSRRSPSSSSLSISSASSVCNSSVMEWAKMEESELSSGPTGFSLLVYAWRK